MVQWMVGGAINEWFKQFKNPTKSVCQFLSTRLYSPGIPKTVTLKIAVKSKETSKRGQVPGLRP